MAQGPDLPSAPDQGGELGKRCLAGGQATEPERLMSVVMASRVRPVWAMKPPSRPSVRYYCMRRSRVRTRAASASVPCGARLARDRFSADHTPSARFNAGVYGGR